MKTSKSLSVLLSVLTALVVLTGSIAVPLLCRPFYYAHIGPMHLENYGLTEREINDYELRPSRYNPDVSRTMAEQASFIGPWEERNGIPADKRLTRWDVSIEGFSPADGVRPEQLAEHYRLAKKFPRIPRQGRSKDPPQRESK